MTFPTGRAGKLEVIFLMGQASKREMSFLRSDRAKKRKMINSALAKKDEVFKPVDKRLIMNLI